MFGSSEVLGGVIASLSLNDLFNLSIEFGRDGLFSGEDPDELVLLWGEELIAARVDNCEVLVISVEDLVVSSNEGNEVDLALGRASLADSLGLFGADLTH